MEHGWALDRTVWDTYVSRARENALHWKKTRLELTHRDLVPPQPGIYAICTTVPHHEEVAESFPNQLYNVMYVGKADVLRRRFLQHCKTPSLHLQRASRCFGPTLDYWYAETGTELNSLLESLLISCFRPVVNLKKGISTINATIRDATAI